MPKNRPAPRKVSTKKKQLDTLKPFRQQSERIIGMLFDDESTPPFLRDLLFEMLNELETETQIFWNCREVAAVAVPRMLKAAQEQGLDFFAERSEIFNAAAYNIRQRAENPYPSPSPSESERLHDELEADAAALSRLLKSPHVPHAIQTALSDTVCEFISHPVSDPAVMRVAYPHAVLDAMKTAKERSGSDE